MGVKILMVFAGLACIASAERISRRNDVWDQQPEEEEKDFGRKSNDVVSERRFYDNLSGTGQNELPLDLLEIEKTIAEEQEEEEGRDKGLNELPIDLLGIEKTIAEEEEEEEERKLSNSEVDEETIRKAEKMADKDLVNGVNRILKNNESLKDILRAENVEEIP